MAGVLATATAPVFVPSSVLGKDGAVSPSNKITLGCIGLGMQGVPNMQSFLGQPDTKVVVVCDTDKQRLEKGKGIVDTHYNNKDCRSTGDFQEVCTASDVDCLSLALPDHWHAIPAVLGAKSGKDIYGEKPLAHTIKEGRAICDAVKKYGRIWQTGSWQRSTGNFRQAVELVLNGRIGKIKHVEVGLPSGHTDFGGTKGQEKFGEPPAHLDYERWLGPAPWAPYAPARIHANWRWILDYGGGQLTDWIGHHNDIAHWGMGADYTGPTDIEPVSWEYPKDGLWNTAGRFRINCTYASGITTTIAGGHNDIRGGTKWIGENGQWVWVDRGGIDANPKELLKEDNAPKEINLLRSPGHHRNFLDCVKSRQQTLTPAEVAHRSMSPGCLGQIAMLLGRKLKWDPEKEQVIGDEAASRMLGATLREPWTLEL
jgi:predicted dehydrogenase